MLKFVVPAVAAAFLVLGCGRDDDQNNYRSLTGGIRPRTITRAQRDGQHAHIYFIKDFQKRCQTEKVAITSKEHHCKLLADEAVNKGCALGPRILHFKILQCPGNPPTK